VKSRVPVTIAMFRLSACRAQLEVRFRGEADIDRQAKLAGSVENGPTPDMSQLVWPLTIRARWEQASLPRSAIRHRGEALDFKFGDPEP
jgi:hypothetical protein